MVPSKAKFNDTSTRPLGITKMVDDKRHYIEKEKLYQVFQTGTVYTSTVLAPRPKSRIILFREFLYKLI